MGRKPTIARLINLCWFFFKLGVTLMLVAAVAIGVYLFTRMDDEIRRYVQQTLTDHFPHLNISVGGARLVEGRGIAIYDLTVSETSSTQLQNNLLVVDEIMLVCDVQLSQLMNGAPTVQRVIVKHPQLWVSRHANGRWNIESLWPLPQPCQIRPQVVIQDAQVTFSDQRQASLSPLTLRDVNFTIGGAKENATEQPIEFTGSLSGPNIKRVEIQAKFDPVQQSIQIVGDVRQLQLTSELLAWTTAYAGALVGPSVLYGNVDGKFTVQYQIGGETLPQVEARWQLYDGRLEDPRLPQPLTEVTATVACKGTTFKVEELRGNCGSANLALTLQRQGWSRTAPLAMAVRVENLTLDKKLYRALPPMLQDQWDKYQPTGLVDADVQLTFDGARWKPLVTLTGRELAFESDKFSYRVTDGSGTMHYRLGEDGQPATLDIDLVAYGGGQPLKIVGRVFDPAPGARGWAEITGQNVEIEQRMIAALPDKTREVIQSMHPEGRFNLYWRLERSQLGQEKLRKSLRLELVETRVKYEKFPYPLSGIRGWILAEDDHWTFRDLVSGGSRSVQCQGYLRPTAGGKELSLQFTGQQIPLDGDLKQAVPSGVAQAWEELRPRGQIDLTADVYHLTGYAKPDIRVSVRPRPESASLEPRFFPYLLEKVGGTLTYHQGQVLMTEFKAQHGRTTIRTNGSGNFAEDGSWEVKLEGLSADRLTMRREFVGALPLKLQKLIDQLKPTGSFALQNSSMRFAKPSDPTAPLESQWDVQLECHQTDIQAGIELRNIHGMVRLVGESKGSQCYQSGELEIDTATFQGVQFTEIRGPIWIDETRCLLGNWASKQQGRTPRHITAKIYDGHLVGDAWVTYDGLPQYGAQVSVVGADLLRIMTERFNGGTDFRGKVAANLSLRGRGRQLENLEGEGDVKITDAEIYELPLLVGLLKVLRNSTPDSTAFNESDVKFRIQGRHIYLDQLDFLGDAVSLFGKGYTNFDQQLNLAFYGIVGRNEIRVPFIKNFWNQVGQQTMQMYVDGTLSDPQIHTQAFPMVNQLIQQIQTDLDATGVGSRRAQRGSPVAPSGQNIR
ncbi:MAG: DUF748 domain-containing protein [Planctomycetes bacterium]|nr:DUF748 domain-containing protein [Planctomycetota bacterium]